MKGFFVKERFVIVTMPRN